MKYQKRIVGIFLACILGASLATAGEQIFDIRDQGAVADGKTLCTAAIQKTIDRCAADGGGTVYFPPGTWLSGTIELRSHITLKLDAGCRLLGSPSLDDYPKRLSQVPTYTTQYPQRSLIYAADVENVGICGRGTIDGNASKFPFSGGLRPFGIRMILCRDVRVEGVALKNSAMWMQHYLACQRVQIHGISVHNHVNTNNDGIDIDGCRDVVVSDCVIDSDDDSIVLKSSGDRRCENVTVTNCVLSSHCAALKLGTESTGGFRNITFSNCAVFSPAATTRLGKDPSLEIYRRGGRGIAIGMYDGATLENVTVSNITIDGVRTPISVYLVDRGRMYRDDLPKPPAGMVRNVIINNIVATDGKSAILVEGVPDRPVENVQLSNIHVTLAKGEDEQASGIQCRNVAGLKLRDITIRTDRSELSNTVSNVKRLLIDGLDVQMAGDARPTLKATDCPGMVLRDAGRLQVEEEAKR